MGRHCSENQGLRPSTGYLEVKGDPQVNGGGGWALVAWPSDAPRVGLSRFYPNYPCLCFHSFLRSSFDFSLWAHSGVPGPPRPRLIARTPLALTPRLLGHRHEVAVGNVPQVLRSLGESQGIGRDGSCMGTQGPSTCFLPQEGVCSDDGDFLGESGEEGQRAGHLGSWGEREEAGGQERADTQVPLPLSASTAL